MNKIYILATALFLGANTNAQQLVDFEAVNLAPESYADGSAGNGAFVFNSEISFSNYSDEWGIQRGYTVSNMTDVNTAGFGNQYSVYAGNGSDGSENFGVYTPEAIISSVSSQAIRINSFKITNTTYAAISMRDGDAFAKQFGSITDASGRLIYMDTPFNSGLIRVDASSWSNGIYFITIQNSNGQLVTEKLIKN